MFSENLKRLREQCGITQTGLANEIGTKQQTVSAWETRMLEPDIQSLCVLADYFGVSIDYLVGHSTPQPEDINKSIKKLLDSLTPEQTLLFCSIVTQAMENNDNNKKG